MILRKLIIATLLLIESYAVIAKEPTNTITANFKNFPLSKAISIIEARSQYKFFYEEANLDLNQRVSLEANKTPVNEAISSLLSTTDISYKIINKQIVLFKKAETISKKGEPSVSVSGKIVDNNNLPLVGVSIINEDKNTGVISDSQGNFSIVADPEDNLTISCLGYATVNRKARGNLRILLNESSTNLDALVVIGYGSQKKANLLGAVSQISSDEIKDRPVSNLGRALQGAIPNLNITYGSGLPGQETGLNIRGVASINGSGMPLVLIDGVEGSIDRINPNDVESVSVLKDAASAAIYGARAGFGVILITTKTRRDGSVRISYNGRYSISAPTASTDFISKGYDAAMIVDEFSRSYNGTPYTRYDGEDYKQLWIRREDKSQDPSRQWVVQKNGKYMYYGNFDWYNYLFNYDQESWNHDLSISGGTNKFSYLISGNLYKKDGLYAQNTDKYKNNSLNMKFSSQVNSWLSIIGNTRLYHSNYWSPGYDFESGGNIPNYTFHALPFIVPTNPDGSNVFTNAVSSNAPADGFTAMVNSGNAYSQLILTQYDTSIGGTISPLKGWDIVGKFSYKRYLREKTFRSANMVYSEKFPDTQIASTGFFSDKLRENYQTQQHYTYDLFTTYENVINGHNFKVLLGMNHESYMSKRLSGSKKDIQSSILNDLNLGVGVSETQGGQDRWRILGFFSRINYDYKGKYLIEANMRYDGTSRFPSQNRWGFFPSLALGWRISDEPFMANIRSIVNNFKIRASIGSLGNQAISDSYPYIQSLTPNLSDSYVIDGQKIYITKLDPRKSGDLTWETVISKNLGIDLAFFNGRLSLIGDFYIRDTKDMLIPGKKLPGVYGMSSPKMNAGDLRTKGYELSLGWQDSFNMLGKPFIYSFNCSLADSRAIITKFDNPDKSLLNYIVGRDIGEIWGYHIEGLFKSDMEAALRPVDQSFVNRHIYNGAVGKYKGLKAGDLIYSDLDGNNIINQGDYTIDNPGDLKVIGNSRPRWHYGINANASWHGFDFSIFLQGIGRQHIYPGASNMLFWGPYARPYASFIPKIFLTDVWDETNPEAYYPKVRGYARADGGSLAQVNDRYLQNLAYLRLKNITVGYTIPKSITSKISVDKIRLYFSGDNLMTLSRLKSDYLDPEQMTSDPNGRVYPFSKTFSFGVDISF